MARGPLVNLFWTLMGRIIGMTRFTRLGLTIRNTIGKFSEGGLGYDLKHYVQLPLNVRHTIYRKVLFLMAADNFEMKPILDPKSPLCSAIAVSYQTASG